MRRPPVTVLFSDTITTVAAKMFSNNIGAVIVMSGGNPVGMITERDIVDKVVRGRRDQDKTHARDIMSTPIVSIESNRSIKDALKVMNEKGVRRLAVTKKGKLVGIVTERRILNALV